MMHQLYNLLHFANKILNKQTMKIYYLIKCRKMMVIKPPPALPNINVCPSLFSSNLLGGQWWTIVDNGGHGQTSMWGGSL